MSFLDRILLFFSTPLFGYLLHALELTVAQTTVGILYPRRAHFGWRVAVCFCTYMFLSVALGMFFERTFPYFRYLVAFLITLIQLPFCLKASVWENIFCCIIGASIQNLSYSCCIFAVGLFGMSTLTPTLASSLLATAVYVAVHSVFSFLTYRKMKNVKGEISVDKGWIVIISLLFIFVIYIIQHDHQDPLSVDFLWWRITFIVMNLMLGIALFSIFDKGQLEQENAVLAQLRREETKKYEMDEAAVEALNLKCHDLKNQIIALRALPGAGKERALDDVENAVMMYDAIVQTGCKPFDIILSSKYLLCEKNKIRLTYMVDGNSLSFMRESDVYSLFGNALDNAIRSLGKIEDEEKKVVNLSVTAKNGFLIIHIENYCEEKLTFEDGLPVTTQEDKTAHGFGMLSMRRTAEAYGGVLSAELKDNLFALDFTLPIPNG